MHALITLKADPIDIVKSHKSLVVNSLKFHNHTNKVNISVFIQLTLSLHYATCMYVFTHTQT